MLICSRLVSCRADTGCGVRPQLLQQPPGDRLELQQGAARCQDRLMLQHQLTGCPRLCCPIMASALEAIQIRHHRLPDQCTMQL